MRALQRRDPAMSVERRRAQDPRPGPAEDRLPAKPVGGRVERPDQADGLALAAVRGTRSDVSRQEAAISKLHDVSRERTGERTPCCLHIANPKPGTGLRR